MSRVITAVAGLLLLSGCGATVGPPSLNDMCRDARNCAPRCGSVATGASPDCSPAENEGRTRG